MRGKFLTPFLNPAKCDDGKIATNPTYGRAAKELIRELIGLFTGILFLIFISIIIMYIDLPWYTVGLVRQYSGDVYQRTWNHILDIFGDDLFTLFVYGTTLLLNGLYWAVGLTNVLMDITGKPQWIKKYKIQPGKNDPLYGKRSNTTFSSQHLTVIRQVLFNQICVGIPFAYAGYWVMNMCGSISSDIRQLPSLEKIILDLIVCVLCREVAFYYSHSLNCAILQCDKHNIIIHHIIFICINNLSFPLCFVKHGLLHHRRLFKYIHKRHHEWQSPIAVTAIYCHPIEHILTNMIPPMLGPTLMRSHLSIIWIWFSYVILLTLSDHSGYHLPGVPSPEAHDFHHLKTTQFFGLLGLLDYLHGTDKLFRSAPPYKRHRTLLKLESLRSLYPD